MPRKNEHSSEPFDWAEAPRGGRPHHEVFHRFRCWEGIAPGKFWVNFLGVRTSTTFLATGHPAPSRDRYLKTEYPPFEEKPLFRSPEEGAVEWVDLPEEYFEWIDLLEAVTCANKHFTMIELGAGWGRWITNAVAALQQSNDLPYTLIAVEAEPTHFQWMKQHLEVNGVDLSRCKLIEAAITDREGTIGFYTGTTSWGGPADWYGQAIGGQTQVNSIALRSLLRPLSEAVDLLDLDVQGAELMVVEAATEEINERVKKVHIGTHSREIEAGLQRVFEGLGWKNIHNFPPQSESQTAWGLIKFQDGVQSWVNPRFFDSDTVRGLTDRRVATPLGLIFCVGLDDEQGAVLLRDGVLDATATDLMTRLVRPGDTCVDAQGVFGYHTCLLARLVGRRGKVYVFEPDQERYERIRRNVAINNLSNVAELIPTAFGYSHMKDVLEDRQAGRVRLLKGDAVAIQAMLSQELEPLLSRKAIDLILINCEGHERGSLERVSQCLRKAGYAALECGPNGLANWSERESGRQGTAGSYLFKSPSTQVAMPALSLAAALNELNERQAQLQAQMTSFKQQRNNLQGCEQTLKQLETQVETVRSQMAQLQTEREELRNEASSLREQLEKSRDDVAFTMTMAQEAEEQLARLRSEKKAMEERWREIERSAGWRMLNAWRQLRDRLAPMGSRRRGVYDSILNKLRSN